MFARKQQDQKATMFTAEDFNKAAQKVQLQ